MSSRELISYMDKAIAAAQAAERRTGRRQVYAYFAEYPPLPGESYAEYTARVYPLLVADVLNPAGKPFWGPLWQRVRHWLGRKKA